MRRRTTRAPSCPLMADDALVMFHDLVSPHVAAGLAVFRGRGVERRALQHDAGDGRRLARNGAARAARRRSADAGGDGRAFATFPSAFPLRRCQRVGQFNAGASPSLRPTARWLSPNAQHRMRLPQLRRKTPWSTAQAAFRGAAKSALKRAVQAERVATWRRTPFPIFTTTSACPSSGSAAREFMCMGATSAARSSPHLHRHEPRRRSHLLLLLDALHL